jgi:hypothetical protein
MKKWSLFFVVVLLLSLAATSVFAGEGPMYHDRSGDHHGDKFIDRIENQQRRINQGVRSGELTRKEAAVLQDNLDWIKGKYTRMKSDNMLTLRERERLDSMLDQNGEMIRNKKHNPAKRLYDAEIEGRMRNQQDRIDHGITSRELTRREADIVQDNLKEIRRRYARMREDGSLTMREIEKLDRMLDENSRMITQKERNRKYDIRRLY